MRYIRVILICLILTVLLYIPHIPIGFWVNPPTSSMEPAITDCDISVYGPGEPEVDDVMMYWEDEDKLIMHRIIDEKPDGYVFKGDANDRPDEGLVDESQIQSEVYTVLNLGISDDTCESMFIPLINSYEDFTGNQIIVPD